MFENNFCVSSFLLKYIPYCCNGNTLRNHRIFYHRHLHRNLTGTNNLTQSAGIGGGPIINICLMVGLGLDAKKSMSITYLFLMGGAAASMYKNFKKIDPQTNKLQMNYDLIMMTLPMTATGSIFGV